MRQRIRIFAAAFGFAAVAAVAGDLTVEGNLNVTSNLTASSISATNATMGSLVVNGSAIFFGQVQGDGSGITNLTGTVSTQELAQAMAAAASTQSLAAVASGLAVVSQSVVSAVAGLATNTVPLSRAIAINGDVQSLDGDAQFFVPPNPANVTDFTYFTNAVNGIVITGYSGPNDVVIPDTINGLPVTGIGDCAFSPGITGSGVTSVSGGANVKTVGEGALLECDALTSVSLPAAVSIGGYAFGGCDALTAVTLPAAASIGEGAFYVCFYLTSVSLPAAASIGGSAFGECSSLTAVTLPAAASIGAAAFFLCPSLTSVSLPAAASIGDWAFSECSSLTAVTLPSAESIGYGAFTYCSSLTSVSLPSAESIGDWAFANCPALTSVRFFSDAPAIGYDIYNESSAVINNVQNPTAAGWGATLGDRPVVRAPVYGDGSHLTGITAAQAGAASTQELVQAIAAATTALVTTQSLTQTLSSLASTQSLAAVVSSLAVVSQSVVSAVAGLATNTVPLSRAIAINGEVQSLDGDAQFFVPPNPANVTDFTYFTNASNGIVITGYSGPNDVVIPDTINGLAVTEIGDSAFSPDHPGYGITSVSGGANVKTVGAGAFDNCPDLTSVSLPAAASIGDYAFEYCMSLTSVTLPAAASIGNSAFDYCWTLTSVSLPAAASIGDYAFEYCMSLTSVTLPAAASIGDYAFEYCMSLTSVSLPAAASIGDFAFNFCFALTSVSLPVAESIGVCAFSYCPALTSVRFFSDAPAIGYALYIESSAVINYVQNPTAAGWGPTLDLRPVVRVPINGDGSGLVNLNLQAYAGDNLTWMNNKLHAQAVRWQDSADSNIWWEANGGTNITVYRPQLQPCCDLLVSGLSFPDANGRYCAVDLSFSPYTTCYTKSSGHLIVIGDGSDMQLLTPYWELLSTTGNFTPPHNGWSDLGYGAPVTEFYPDYVIAEAASYNLSTGDVWQAVADLYPRSNPADYASVMAVDGMITNATANLLTTTGNGSQLTGITAAQVGAYTINQTDTAIAGALSGFNQGSCVQTNHTGNVSIQGSVSASSFTGNGAGVTNLKLEAYVGSNLVWDAVSNKLHAAAGGSGYTDADAVDAVTAVTLNMNANRVTGLANAIAETDAVNLQTATNIVQNAIQAALLHVGPFGDVSMGSFTTP